MMNLATVTHPGLRENNEDAVVSDPRLGLMAIADGMGGHRAGEVASKMALESIRGFLIQASESDDFTWPCAIDPTLSTAGNRLQAAVKVANRDVFQKSGTDAAYEGMGTTVVAAIVTDGVATLAGVGDSRIYEFSNGQLRQLTRDDSWIEAMSREKSVDAEQLKTHPMRNVLTNVVGSPRDVTVRVTEMPLEDRQVLLLCTDGLHRALPDDTIAAVLRDEPDLDRAAKALVSMAVERDGSDNVTVVLARYLNAAS
jgi:protein phosphatase